ncbi:uncharacterized protein JCM10292_003829 [Rhodotorula paludigena]|uniref:uncharacterized protein n=1 Tax=Rhodotorula paludigena TaxID=86838 RepID=UPI003177DA58
MTTEDAKAAAKRRGRKQDDSLPPSRSRDIQRAFRARRAALLANLETRVAFLEHENLELRRRCGLSLDGPPVSGPEPQLVSIENAVGEIEVPGAPTLAGKGGSGAAGGGAGASAPPKKRTASAAALDSDVAAPHSRRSSSTSQMVSPVTAQQQQQWPGTADPQVGAAAEALLSGMSNGAARAPALGLVQSQHQHLYPAPFASGSTAHAPPTAPSHPSPSYATHHAQSPTTSTAPPLPYSSAPSPLNPSHYAPLPGHSPFASGSNGHHPASLYGASVPSPLQHGSSQPHLAPAPGSHHDPNAPPPPPFAVPDANALNSAHALLQTLQQVASHPLLSLLQNPAALAAHQQHLQQQAATPGFAAPTPPSALSLPSTPSAVMTPATAASHPSPPSARCSSATAHAPPSTSLAPPPAGAATFASAPSSSTSSDYAYDRSITQRAYLLGACGSLPPLPAHAPSASGSRDPDAPAVRERKFRAFCETVVEGVLVAEAQGKIVSLGAAGGGKGKGKADGECCGGVVECGAGETRERGVGGAKEVEGGQEQAGAEEECCGGLIDCSSAVFDSTPSYPTAGPAAVKTPSNGPPTPAATPGTNSLDRPTTSTYTPLGDVFLALEPFMADPLGPSPSSSSSPSATSPADLGAPPQKLAAMLWDSFPASLLASATSAAPPPVLADEPPHFALHQLEEGGAGATELRVWSWAADMCAKAMMIRDLVVRGVCGEEEAKERVLGVGVLTATRADDTSSAAAGTTGTGAGGSCAPGTKCC